MNETRQSICVVVPCYNEANRLDREKFREFFRKEPQIRFIFIDDGSEDETALVLNKLCHESQGRATMLSCGGNLGKAEAVRMGVLYALASFSPDFVGYWDADLATPLNAILDLTNAMHQKPRVEMTFGARVKLLGKGIERRRSRHYLGRMFATIASIILRLPIYDTQCGAKVFRVNAATTVVFGEQFISKWIFDVEIIARYLRYYNFDFQHMEKIIVEYPLESWKDIGGSKIRPADFIRSTWEMFQIYLSYMRPNHIAHQEQQDLIRKL